MKKPPPPPANSLPPPPTAPPSAPPIDLSKWLTLKEAAALLGYVNGQTVSLLIGKGELRAVDRSLHRSLARKADYRVDPDSVQAFIRSRIVGAAAPSPVPPMKTLPPGVKRFV
jgi:hypothetical protein